MATFRQRALDEAAMHKTGRYYVEEGPISNYFGRNVLDLDKMKDYMSARAYEAVLSSVKFGAKLDLSVADEIAAGMMKWGMEMGATHYTHLFQPLTDSTAEKHEAFVTVKNGNPFEKFNGSALVQQEPDASASRTEVLEIPLRPVAILHGIRRLLSSLWMRRFVFRQFSYPIQVRRLIPRCLILNLFTL